MTHTPDTQEIHPIILHGDLYAEYDYAPQTQFVPERQVAFLEALATTGSVRTAARRVKVSHQTCYRARRNSAAFGRAWDAALVVARGAAEAKLADCAMEGIEEEVWYHGEMVGTRRRMSDRLLLAHLGRLDRMRKDERIEALAEDFDGLLTRMRRGEAIELEPAPAAGGVSSPGQCNMRSMSRAEDAHDAAPPSCDCMGTATGLHPDAPHFERSAEGWEPVCNTGEGAGPCCDAPSWPGCRSFPHYPPYSRLLNAMEDARPADAPGSDAFGEDAYDAEACQMAAFEAGDADWWRYGAGWVLYARDAGGSWVPEGASGGAREPTGVAVG